ncbi:MAG TPA: hypothetical protein VGH34_13505 [Vicinamibacterales bacterium]
MTFKDGLVWLSASAASARDILTEWGRVGGTRVIAVDHLDTAPLSFDLRGVPEMEALSTILRASGGFVTSAWAPETAAQHPSRFAGIAVITARAPLNAVAPTPSAPVPPPQTVVDPSGAQRIIGADGQFVPDDQDGAPAPPPAQVPAAPAPRAPAVSATPGTVPPRPSPPVSGGRGGGHGPISES